MKIRLTDDNNVLRRKTIDLQPGLTVLIGCNGAGKTTVLDGIEDWACSRRNDVLCFSYNDRSRGGHTLIEHFIMRHDSSSAAHMLFSSEGERIVEGIWHFVCGLKKKLQNAEGKDVVIIFDAIDSGMSLDVISDFKAMLHRSIDERSVACRDLYVIVAAISYGMCRGERCFDVSTWSYCENLAWDQYEDLIFRSREWKDKRDKRRYENQNRKRRQKVSEE